MRSKMQFGAAVVAMLVAAALLAAPGAYAQELTPNGAPLQAARAHVVPGQPGAVPYLPPPGAQHAPVPLGDPAAHSPAAGPHGAASGNAFYTLSATAPAQPGQHAPVAPPVARLAGPVAKVASVVAQPQNLGTRLMTTALERGLALLSGNEPHLLSENEAELLSGNKTKLLADITSKLLSDNEPELLSGNNTKLLSDNEPEILSGNRVNLFSGNKVVIRIENAGNNNLNNNSAALGPGGRPAGPMMGGLPGGEIRPGMPLSAPPAFVPSPYPPMPKAAPVKQPAKQPGAHVKKLFKQPVKQPAKDAVKKPVDKARRAKERFKKLDANGDGAISPDEFAHGAGK